MRDSLGLIAANLALLPAGYGVLMLCGITPRDRLNVVLAGGLALLLGISVLMTANVFLLILGISIHSSVTLALSLLLFAAGVAVRVRAGSLKLRRPTGFASGFRDLVKPTPERIVLAIALAGLALFMVIAWRYYAISPAATFDEFAIWSKKALALFHFASLEPDFFVRPAYLPMHQEYPMLLPLLEAFVFQVIGHPETRLVHVEFLFILVAFAGAAAFICRERGAGITWLPVIGVVLVAPFVHDQLSTGYADLPMSMFICLGLLCMGVWFEDGRAAWLVPAALLLGGAAQMKFEALMAVLLAFAVLAAIHVAGRARDRLKQLALAGAGVLAMILPWNVWVQAHPEILSFFSPKRGFDPVYLTDHLDLPREALELIGRNLTNPDLMLLGPAALALVLVCVFTRVARPVAAFYLATATAVTAGLVWIYWVDPTTWSPNRVIDVITFIGVAALLQLLGSIERRVSDSP